jgi:CubicO group peptidase (beta-lactamase class C family)
MTIQAIARALLPLPGLLLMLPAAAPAQVPPPGFEIASPAEVGLSGEGLARATEVLRAHVEGGDLAGVVAAVMRDGKLVYLEALGHRDLEIASPMPTDALFRVYSMTRPITAVAVLMLHDEGRLDVRHPVQRYLPQFAEQRVLRSPGSNDASDTRPRIGDVTIAQLLTHTSGIGSRSSEMYRRHEVHGYDRPLSRVVDNVAAVPLFEDPGTQFRYGMSAEILGRVIEEVSGMPVEQFLEERIFRPLGMTETVFYVDPARAARLATVYRPGAAGLQAIEMETIPVTERRALTSSGVGLVSSTLDFLRFSQFLLDGGVVNGRRLLSPEGVRMAAENAIPSGLMPIGNAGYWLGSGWSLGGFAVALDPAAYDHTVSRGEYWWDGSAGTRFWIDPAENMITIVMAQVSPASGNRFRERFKDAVYAAIEDTRATDR